MMGSCYGECGFKVRCFEALNLTLGPNVLHSKVLGLCCYCEQCPVQENSYTKGLRNFVGI